MLTERLIERIAEGVRAGNYASVAAQRIGISPSSVNNWLRQGRDAHPTRQPTELTVKLADAVDKAEAEFESRTVAWLGRHEHWRPRLEVLKRREPERWGDVTTDSDRSAAVLEALGGLLLARTQIAINEAPRIIEGTVVENSEEAGAE